MSAAPLSPIETLAPRLDASARLLVLLAKVVLGEAQKQEARSLAAQIQDWQEFTQIATRKFVVTLAHRHLRACAADLVPALAMECMRLQARATIMSTLRVAAAQIAFHKSCIQRSDARHAYVKGIALARHYYSSVGDRFCRDIDVLVAAKDFAKVIGAAVSSGYRVMIDDEDRFTDDARDIRFLARHADVVTLVGADSIGIEVHRRLDKLSLNFNLELAFTTAHDLDLSGFVGKTLSPTYHFNYICYHHSRHYWSHLHWLADLDAMVRSPDCDRARIEAMADTIGIRPTVDAAFEFQQLISQPGLWGTELSIASGGGQFLKACLINLAGGLDLEIELRAEATFQDFMSAWQISPGRYKGFLFNSWLRRLRPSVTQYFDHKYPSALHWIYSLQNLVALSSNGLALAGNAVRALRKPNRPPKAGLR